MTSIKNRFGESNPDAELEKEILAVLNGGIYNSQQVCNLLNEDDDLKVAEILSKLPKSKAVRCGYAPFRGEEGMMLLLNYTTPEHLAMLQNRRYA